VDPEALVGRLSVGERQRVEILKALYRGARILILDEPTAVLTPQESEALFAVLGQMVAQGLSIIFISHKLGEVLRVSQRIAVLRAGRMRRRVRA
jgi:simple sugar transport system ATP-binding protein